MAESEPKTDKQASGDFTWYRPVGIPVYGADREATPPDFERAWQPPAVTSPTTTVQPSYTAPPPAEQYVYTAPASHEEAPPPPPPVEYWQSEGDDPIYLFPATGPAMTPDERLELLKRHQQ